MFEPQPTASSLTQRQQEARHLRRAGACDAGDPIYKKIISTDVHKKQDYGHLPVMAACSKGQIGALNAESFCERVLSAANLVVTDGNTLIRRCA
eukprot:928125-Prymnesium_polylepis.1